MCQHIPSKNFFHNDRKHDLGSEFNEKFKTFIIKLVISDE